MTEKAKTLMIQGTASDVGKSVIVAGICRILANRGKSVTPFKPQNMALNSAVTEDGGEIGRAQALQAQAAKVKPHTDMNPILLKPSSDTGAQVIIHGKALSNMEAQAYHDYKKVAMKAVLESHDRLCCQYERIIVEGAGSPAEINLREGDVANMGFAEAADCPVILVADIDKGGVFAQIVGTLELLSPSERDRVVGFIINKFRGDIALLEPGLDWLEQKTNKPVLAVINYLHGLHLEAEDAIQSENVLTAEKPLKVVVPVLPRISNHTDFDALRLNPQVDLTFVGLEQEPPACDMVILPGSKCVSDDIAFLKNANWEAYLNRHLRYGGKLIGICGGFQMLGTRILDPEQIETTNEKTLGFGFLEMETTLCQNKALENVEGVICGQNKKVKGYEIHAGVTKGQALERPFCQLGERYDGAISEDKQIIGTYIHGLFDQVEAQAFLLEWAGLENPEVIDERQTNETQLERLAEAIEKSLTEKGKKIILD